MKVKNCMCLYCHKKLAGFTECNCEKKAKNNGLWKTKNRKYMGRGRGRGLVKKNE
jgi:hypothetical protein